MRPERGRVEDRTIGVYHLTLALRERWLPSIWPHQSDDDMIARRGQTPPLSLYRGCRYQTKTAAQVVSDRGKAHLQAGFGQSEPAHPT
jgi:hypothetical protein